MSRTAAASDSTPAPSERRDRSHVLYLAVLAAVALGIAVGLVFPDFAKELKPLGTGFGNLIKPGSGLQLTGEVAKTGQSQASGEASSTTDFLLGVIPKTLFSSLTEGQVLQALLVALLAGFAIQSLGERGQPALAAVAVLQRVVFKVLAMIMWVAPVGAFGAMAAVVAPRAPTPWWRSAGSCWASTRPACSSCSSCSVLGTVLRVVTGLSAFKLLRYLGVSRPVVGRHRAHGVLVQPRRHGDLPDDGVTVHRRGVGQAAGAR